MRYQKCFYILIKRLLSQAKRIDVDALHSYYVCFKVLYLMKS